jgi:Ni,Fe-hydrogenase maturation factor
MHLATPERSLTLARALGVLPSQLLMVGCQPLDPNAVSETMSAPVAAAVDIAVAEIVRHLDELLTEASSGSGS